MRCAVEKSFSHERVEDCIAHPAIQIEDQEMPKRCGHLSGKSVVSAEAMSAKIRAAAAAKRDRDFVIIARTDAKGVHGFDDGVRRAKLYLEAGADAICPQVTE